MQGTASSKFKIDRKPAGSKVHFHVYMFSLIPYSVLFSLSFSYLFWHPTLTSLKFLFEVLFMKFLLFILTSYINFSQILIWGFFIKFLLFILTPYINLSQILIWGFFNKFLLFILTSYINFSQILIWGFFH